MIHRKIQGLIGSRKLQTFLPKEFPVAFLQSRVLKYDSFAACSTKTGSSEVQPKREISKAMKAYLERAKEHEHFMKQQNFEFQIGKRHLANMMGEDPETFSQEDIDNAIEYLFPSGLFIKKSRPMMKPPEEIFPQRKAAEFDETGRPYHPFFYTARPNFYQLLHNVVQQINEINKFEDLMIKKGNQPDPNLILQLTGYQWTDKTFLETELVETITEKEYLNFVNVMETLSSLPYSYKAKDFILKYKKPLMQQTTTSEAPKPQYDEDGRAYITTYGKTEPKQTIESAIYNVNKLTTDYLSSNKMKECLRKKARGHVTIRSPGTGKVAINGQDITYFEDIQSREQILSHHPHEL